MLYEKFSVTHTDGVIKDYCIVNSETSPAFRLLNIDSNGIYTLYRKSGDFSGYPINVSENEYNEMKKVGLL